METTIREREETKRRKEKVSDATYRIRYSTQQVRDVYRPRDAGRVREGGERREGAGRRVNRPRNQFTLGIAGRGDDKR